MKEYAKSRQSLYIALVVSGVVVGGGAFFYFFTSTEQTPEPTLSINEARLQDIVEKTASIDTDGDGLKDWEEVLYKTDPRNPDTDGDTVPDGEEVNRGHDPLVVGEGNITQGKEAFREEAIEALPETEKLAFRFFEGYINLKEKDYLGTNIQDNFIAGLVAENTPEITARSFTRGDILTTSQTDKETALTYRTHLAAALQPLLAIQEDELVTFAHVIENDDTSKLAALAFAQEKYIESIQNILAVRVPEDASSIHLDILNAFSFFSSVLDTMVTIQEDPLIALVAIDGYEDAEVRMNKAFSRLNTYFLSKGISQQPQ